jgi:hypothetical protein
MANTDRRRSGAVQAGPGQNKCRIPTDPSGPQYADDLGRYLDQLLDEALEETVPASDSLAVPTLRDIEKQ